MSPSQNPQGAAASQDERGTIAETENVIDTYQICAEWIRFADAKAAVVLTVNGALASVLIPTLGSFLSKQEGSNPAWFLIAAAAFGIWGFFAVLSAISAVRCIQPYRNRKNEHPAKEHCRHFHAAAITQHYSSTEVEKFQQGFQALGVEGFQQEVLAGLLIDAHISSAKYHHVAQAIRLLTGSAIPGFIYLMLNQF